MSKTKFGINADGKKSNWVRIKFVDLTEKQLGYLHKAEMALLKAGVSFDTGYNFGTKTRDWEFDWSLKGCIVKTRKG